ncbi:MULTISPECIES: class I SAM-dependent methyltransferase [unclassified Synechococcus]|uniref:class I SAM-dependent methyltransferase n=1 Tax=unclassified Synechococcus TaxID=2626047 RepID=UPI001C2375C6|nr:MULTISPECIES: class I SAM-dependent methyltransferase [unclassified Synechococcus]
MQRDLNAEATQYHAKAPTIFENDLVLNWYPQRILQRLHTGRSILELGIGHGITARIFHEVASRHVLIEGASVVIEQFRAEHPDLDCEIQHCYFEDFETLEKFDYIVMGFILEHVDDPRMVLQRYAQYLAPGGKLFVAVPNGKSLNRRIGYAMGKINDLYDLNANDVAMGHQRQYCVDTLTADLESSGYELTHLEGIYLKPLPLPVLQRMEDAAENFQALLQVGIDFPELSVGLLVEAQLR